MKTLANAMMVVALSVGLGLFIKAGVEHIGETINAQHAVEKGAPLQVWLIKSDPRETWGKPSIFIYKFQQGKIMSCRAIARYGESLAYMGEVPCE